MKRILEISVVIVLMFSLAACAENMPPSIDKPTNSDRPNGGTVSIDKIYLSVNGNRLNVKLAENSSVDALVSILKRGDITYTASDYGGFEKVGSIGHSLPTNHTHTTAAPGDVILYGSDNIVIFYGNNSWDYTRIGRIDGFTASQLRELLGSGSAKVTISMNQ